jgi:hypothetical protein
MNRYLTKIIQKFYFEKWIIGIFRGNIYDIIRKKTFNPDIKWLSKGPINIYYADPFLINSKDEHFKILLEEYSFDSEYGKISLMTLDKNFREINHKVLLDTKSHLSYPFVITENNKTYMFPEAGKSGKLSCYEYDPVNESICFIKDILDLPLCDSSILKQDDKYWIFGTLSEIDTDIDKITDYKLCVFFSDNLLGPYVPHPGNPVKNGLDGIRSAGNFIEVDGIIYRPTQNCKNVYGESMTINRVTELNENTVVEEPYMIICINKRNRYNHGIHTIHTINVMDDIIVVDGIKRTFSPMIQIKNFIKYRIEQYRNKKL